MKTIKMLLVAMLMFSLFGCSSGQEITLHLSYGDRTGTYEGEMVDGVPNGTGKFTTTNESGDSWTYEGEFVDGHFQGEGKTTWESGQVEIGTYENDVIVPLSGDEISTLFSSTEDFLNHYVEVTGIVFNKLENDGVTIQIWTDVKNYDNDIMVYLGEDSNDIEENDYVRVIGLVTDDAEYENMFGQSLTSVSVIASTCEEISYIDAVSPTLKTIEVNQTQEQFGYNVTVSKVELAEDETRIYVTVTNNGSDKFSMYSFNGVISQNGKQYEYAGNYEADYPELTSDLLVGNSSEAIIAFPAIEDAPFTFTIDGYSMNWEEDLQPYTFNIE